MFTELLNYRHLLRQVVEQDQSMINLYLVMAHALRLRETGPKRGIYIENMEKQAFVVFVTIRCHLLGRFYGIYHLKITGKLCVIILLHFGLIPFRFYYGRTRRPPFS